MAPGKWGALVAAAMGLFALVRPSLRHAPIVANDLNDTNVGIASPVVWITPAGAVAPTAIREEGEAQVMGVALAALSDAELAELEIGLRLLAARVEIRKNPLGEDLEDGPPDEAVRAVRQRLAPTLTAAHYIARRTASSSDGALTVGIGASCTEAPAGAPCFALFRDGVARDRDEGENRARFLAWPLAAAAVVKIEGEGCDVALEALRARARTPETRIALALDAASLAGSSRSRADDVRAAARAVTAKLAPGRSPEVDALRPLGAPAPPGRLVPPVTLSDGEVLIVPKLGSLSQLDAFAREIDEISRTSGPATRVTWRRRPRALQ